MSYTFVKANATDENIAKYATLLSKVFTTSHKFSFQYLKWLYAQNPLGQIIGTDAFFNGTLVAHNATIPVMYLVDGKQTPAALAVNAVTDHAHQGKGLLIKLGNMTFESVQQHGLQFIVGVANKNSTYSYVQKFGFQLISPLTVLVGIGNILHNSLYQYHIHSFWNSETLQWRLQNPAEKYFLSNNNVFVNTGKLGICALLHSNNYFNLNINYLAKENAPLKMWIGMGENSTKKGIFLNLPNKLKPSPLNFILKDMTGKFSSVKKEEIFFELIDFDAY